MSTHVPRCGIKETIPHHIFLTRLVSNKRSSDIEVIQSRRITRGTLSKNALNYYLSIGTFASPGQRFSWTEIRVQKRV